MKYTLTGTICGRTLKEFAKMPQSSFSLGGFQMEIPINEKNICVPFDWPSYSANGNDDGSMTVIHGCKGSVNIKDCIAGTMTVIHGCKTLFSTGDNSELDACFEDDWERLGITRENLTAETLAKASKIVKFYIDYYPYPEDIGINPEEDKLYLKELCFMDENCKEYPVPKSILDATGNLLEL